MIRLNDKYAIKADENCYSLHEIRIAENDTKTNKKGDEYTVSLECFSCSVSYLLKSLAKRLQRDAVAQTDMTLAEAAKAFREIEDVVHEWYAERSELV